MVYEREREGEGVWAQDEVVNRKEPKPDSSFLKPPQPPDKRAENMQFGIRCSSCVLFTRSGTSDIHGTAGQPHSIILSIPLS
jgi:hypothetical protein